MAVLSCDQRVVNYVNLDHQAIRLPLANTNDYDTKTIYRLNRIEVLGEIEFKLQVSNQKGTKKKHFVNETFFERINQKLSYNLLLVEPIEREQQFTLEIRLVHR